MNFFALARRCAVALMALLLVSTSAWGQNQNPGDGLAGESIQNQGAAVQVGRDTPRDSKTPIFWADGLTQATDFDAYKALGLNTVVVRLTWTPGEGGEISALDLAPQRAFAEQAARRGLNVIYALPAIPSGLDTAFRVTADSDAYLSLWTAWLQDAVASLRQTPRLVGWMLPDDPRSLPFFDDKGFQFWLSQNYATIDVINRQWNTNFDGFDAVTIGDVNAQIALWRGAPLLQDGAAVRDLASVRPQFGQNWAFHPAALALASYKRDAFRGLLTAWVGALRGEDATHLVFSGRLPDYAQLLSLPAGIDVSMPDLAPAVAELDMVTHNPQSIDIARRGGKFAVLPMLSPRETANWPASALPDLSHRWMSEAHARGARGVGFDSWRDLRDDGALSAAIKKEIGQLTAPAEVGIWGQAPVNTVAVLLSPLAEGAMVQMGAPPYQSARGLYGFGEDLVSGEPNLLVATLRWGTAFGGVDYIAPDDLGAASIDGYTTILAPQMLSASGDETRQLIDYVSGGGVLVADLGLGAQQNGGLVSSISPPFANLFGVPGEYDVRPLTFNLSGVTAHDLLPSWGQKIGMQAGLSLTMGDGRDQTAFDGPVGLSPVLPSAIALASGPRLTQPVGRVKRLLSAQLTLNEVGRGFAVFAPFRLWSHWRPGQIGFDAFFGDMLGRGATIALPGAAFVVPSPVSMGVGQTNFAEVVNRAGSVSLTNHNAPGEELQMMEVQTGGAGDWLWSGGLINLSNADFPVVGGRPAPIDNGSELENRVRTVALYAVIAPGDTQTMRMRPIAVQNLAGGSVAAQITDETARHLKLSLWPNSPTIAQGEAQWQPAVGPPSALRLVVVSSPDGYLAVPGSRHLARIIDFAKPVGKKGAFFTVDKPLVADANGRLSVEFSGAGCVVEIAPLP